MQGGPGKEGACKEGLGRRVRTGRAKEGECVQGGPGKEGACREGPGRRLESAILTCSQESVLHFKHSVLRFRGLH